MSSKDFVLGLEVKVMNIGMQDLQTLSTELAWEEETFEWVASLFPYFGNPGGLGLGEQTARVTPSVAKELKKLDSLMEQSGRADEIRRALRQINTGML